MWLAGQATISISACPEVSSYPKMGESPGHPSLTKRITYTMSLSTRIIPEGYIATPSQEPPGGAMIMAGTGFGYRVMIFTGGIGL